MNAAIHSSRYLRPRGRLRWCEKFLTLARCAGSVSASPISRFNSSIGSTFLGSSSGPADSWRSLKSASIAILVAVSKPARFLAIRATAIATSRQYFLSSAGIESALTAEMTRVSKELRLAVDKRAPHKCEPKGGDVMPYEAVRVGRRDLLREAIRAEKRRMLARLSGEYGPGRDRLLRELAAANELITWFDARRTLEGAN